jgi:hypothetical protein
VAPDRVSPVGVAAVHEHVARIERGGQVVEDLVYRRTRRDVKEDRPGWRESCLEVLVGADLG